MPSITRPLTVLIVDDDPSVTSIFSRMLRLAGPGGAIGMVSGYIGGRTDLLIMQSMDVLLSFPSLILGLIVVALLGPDLENLIFAIALTAVAPFARIALTVKVWTPGARCCMVVRSILITASPRSPS